MTAPAPEAPPATPAPEEEPKQQGRTPEEEVAHWKAMARRNEDQAKANKKAADELAQLKESQKTEAQRAAEEAERIKTEAEQLRFENLRYRAASVHGISDENLDLLGTGNEEELMARAEKIGNLEDAVLEVQSLREQVKQLQAQLQQAGMPGPVPLLTPGAPAAPDTSYPTGWFPGLTRSRSKLTNKE